MELRVKVGKPLFRTPSSNTKAGIFGHFYSVRSIAEYYKNGSEDAFKDASNKVYRFETIKPLKLLDLTFIKSFEFLDKNFKDKPFYEQFQKFTGYGLKTLHIRYKFKDKTKNFDRCVYTNKKKYEPVICDYLEDPEDPNNYLHLKLAKEICKLGFDGYFMPEKYLWANTYYYQPDKDLYFWKEFFICDPTEVLKNTGPV
jgi:hypothetical protein